MSSASYIPDLLSLMADVSVVAPTSGQALLRDGDTGLWVNRAVETADVSGLDAALEAIDDSISAMQSTVGGHTSTIADLVSLSHAAATVGTGNGLSVSGQVFSLALVSALGPGAMSAAQNNKLAGVATGATANSSDATLLNRTNHTGTQAISTITGLQDALDGKIAAGSASELGLTLLGTESTSAARDVLGLGTAAVEAATAFAAASHVHAAGDVTSGTLDAARLPAASGSAQGAQSTTHYNLLAGATNAATANAIARRDGSAGCAFNILSGSRFNLSNDLCLMPVINGQSGIVTHWPAQICGNAQVVAPSATLANILLNGSGVATSSACVIVPTSPHANATAASAMAFFHRSGNTGFTNEFWSPSSTSVVRRTGAMRSGWRVSTDASREGYVDHFASSYLADAAYIRGVSYGFDAIAALICPEESPPDAVMPVGSVLFFQNGSGGLYYKTRNLAGTIYARKIATEEEE